MPRIVSLIASATEIVCGLGMGKHLVGRSHECDYPASVLELPVCTGPRFDVNGSSREIDERVKQSLVEATSVYRVDADLLRKLHADVIVTQAQCAVCAVSERDVEEALKQGKSDAPEPRIVTLSPNVLADVWQNIAQVAGALDVPEAGRQLVERLQARVTAIADRARRAGSVRDRSSFKEKTPVANAPGSRALSSPRSPTVACLEWLDPLMAAGNWGPELVALAGGTNLVGQAGKHSPWLTMAELQTLDPDIIIALPCGFDLERTRQEMAVLAESAGFRGLRAVRERHVYVTDGNQYFNRPGPRLVESLEILSEIIHPEIFAFNHQGRGFDLYPACGLAR